MKKLLSILLIVALVLILGACNSSPENKPSSETPIVMPGVLDPNDPYYADGLNDYGLPDLSTYNLEQLVDMYFHPENWSASVLYMTDSSFSLDDEVYSEPEVDEEYVFNLGDWHDYDPGTWTPGPDEITEFDVDWSDFEDPGEYTPPSNELPAEYAFLVPGGIRTGDMVINDEDGLNISLSSRTTEEYNAIVQAAQSHGYTINAESSSFGTMQFFEGSNGTEKISIVYRNNSVLISFDEVDE